MFDTNLVTHAGTQPGTGCPPGSCTQPGHEPASAGRCAGLGEGHRVSPSPAWPQQKPPDPPIHTGQNPAVGGLRELFRGV